MPHMWRCIIVRIKQSTTRDEPQKARRKATKCWQTDGLGRWRSGQPAAGQTWFAGIFKHTSGIYEYLIERAHYHFCENLATQCNKFWRVEGKSGKKIF